MFVLFDRIPFVHGDHAAFPGFVRAARHFGILLGEADRRVDEDHAHVGALDRHFRADDAVPFDGILHLALPAQTGGVDQHKAAEPVFDPGVDRVPCGSGDLRNDAAVLPRDIVDERGFPDVRFADDRNADRLLFLVIPGLFRKLFHDAVQQVAGPVPVDRRNRDRLAEPQIIKFIELRRRIPDRIALIHAKDHRAAAFLQKRRHIRIRRDDAGAHICHEYDHIRRFDRKPGLHAHLRKDHVFGIRLDPTRIHKGKTARIPLAVPENSVSGHARRIIHNGQPSPYQFIKKRRFPHVRSADDRHNRFCQISSLPITASSSSYPSFLTGITRT